MSFRSLLSVITGAEITTVVLAVVLAAVGIYDVIAQVYIGDHATVTTVIRGISREWPIVPFAAGVLAGHLFWGR